MGRTGRVSPVASFTKCSVHPPLTSQKRMAGPHGNAVASLRTGAFGCNLPACTGRHPEACNVRLRAGVGFSWSPACWDCDRNIPYDEVSIPLTVLEIHLHGEAVPLPRDNPPVIEGRLVWLGNRPRYATIVGFALPDHPIA